MVKWYNISLPTIGREFDSPWPHEYKKERFQSAFFVRAARSNKLRACYVRIEARLSYFMSETK